MPHNMATFSGFLVWFPQRTGTFPNLKVESHVRIDETFLAEIKLFRKFPNSLTNSHMRIDETNLELCVFSR